MAVDFNSATDSLLVGALVFVIFCTKGEVIIDGLVARHLARL